MKKSIMLIMMLSALLLMTACTKKDETKENADVKPTDTIQENDTKDAKDTTEDASEQPSEEAVMEPTGKEIVIGILPAESGIPIILAKELGYFEEEGVNVSIKAFSSPNDRNVAVQAKELDAVIGDVMTEASFKQNGINLTITSDISEDFKILSSPDSGITDMAELGGKKVSLVPNFILEYIMDEFAAKYGFTYEIVEIPSFSGRSEALLSNQIDGVVYTEPQAGMLVKQGAHLLGSSKEAGIKGGTLMFTDEMISNCPGDIKAFYRAYNRAIDYMNSTDATEYGNILTEYQFPEAITEYLSSMSENFQYASIIAPDQFDRIIQWTKDKGQISKSYSYEELTDFSFIK